jgi:hypothetical protein
VDNKILAAIRELIEACGAQSFAQINYEVRTQCDVNLEDAANITKAALSYLVSLKVLVCQSDEFGTAWGHESDF